MKKNLEVLKTQTHQAKANNPDIKPLRIQNELLEREIQHAKEEIKKAADANVKAAKTAPSVQDKSSAKAVDKSATSSKTDPKSRSGIKSIKRSFEIF